MRVNDVLRKGDTYLRVLATKDDSCFCINCNASSMPAWMPASELEAYTQEDAPTVNTDLTVRQKQIAHAEIIKTHSFPIRKETSGTTGAGT